MVLFLCLKMKKLFDLFEECSIVCTDTRNIEKDALFICLKGENFNGNDFALKAIEAGAKHVITDEEQYHNGINIHLVENGLIFLQKLANNHRNKFKIPVIGITGSNGKTSTKELLNVVLSKKYNTLATKGNLNNHIGVPLTLLQLTSQHEIAIIEMGANKPFDIQELCEIAEPKYGIITNIGKAHLEGFINFEGVIKTKTELYHSLLTKNGTIVVNAEDSVLTNKLPIGIKTLAYSSNGTGEVNGDLLKLTPYIQLKWSHDDYQSPVIETKMIGKYNFFNFLAAISFGTLFNVDNDKINEAISEYSPNNNRSQIKETTTNTLILDCYNANPTSMLSAIESFSMIENDSKTAIIGDMLELGLESELEHAKIIEYLRELNIEYLTVGPIFLSIQNNKSVQKFKNTLELEEYLLNNPIKNKLILLKGSRGIGLEKLEAVL